MLFTLLTASPADSVPLKPIPVNCELVLGFVIVKFSVSGPFSEVLPFKLSVCEIVGGPITVTDAFEVFPVPPLVETTCTLLFFTPGIVPVTFAEIVHDPPGVKVPLASDTDPAPAVAVTVPPQEEPVKPFGDATTSPAGKMSVNVIPLSVSFVLGLLTANERLVVPFSGIVAAPKLLVIAGGLITVSTAVEVFPFPASLESMVTLLE